MVDWQAGPVYPTCPSTKNSVSWEAPVPSILEQMITQVCKDALWLSRTCLPEFSDLTCHRCPNAILSSWLVTHNGRGSSAATACSLYCCCGSLWLLQVPSTFQAAQDFMDGVEFSSFCTTMSPGDILMPSKYSSSLRVLGH